MSITRRYRFSVCSLLTYLIVDGRLHGNETISTVQCDQSAGTCAIQVPAPSVALVFLTSGALQDVSPSTTQTFSTTAVTKKGNTATIDQTALETSNGNTGADRQKLGSTSKGSSGASSVMPMVPTMAILMATGAVSALLTLGWRQ